MTKTIVGHHVDKARAIYQPLFATFEITHACNFKCSHCYNFDRQNSISPIKRPLNDSEIIKGIKGLAEIGALYLNFTGGEPLLHPSLSLFITEAKKNHFFVRLKTNASLITKEKAKMLYESGLDSIDVSLYGISEKSYKSFTLNSSLKNTIDGIKNAKEAGIGVDISIILHRDNVHELSDMVKLCKSNSWRHQVTDEITDRYDETKASKNLSVTDKQFKDLLSGDFAKSFSCDNREGNLQCSCAQTVCAISLSGDVYPCIGAPIKSGNIREDNLKNIWENSPELNKIRNLKKSDFKECQECSFISTCSRSSGSAYINTGDYTGCDPFALSRAKVRSKNL